MTAMDTLARFRAERLIAEMRNRRKKRLEAEDDCVPCIAASPTDVPLYGLATLYDTWSSDGGEIRRMIERDAVVWDLEEEGVPIVVEHDGGVLSVVGRLDSAKNTKAGVEVTGRLFGPEDPDDEAFHNLVNKIEENALGWSVLLSEEEGRVKFIPQEVQENNDGSMEMPIGIMQELVLTHARMRHLALVDTPAFPGARPIIGEVPAAIAAAATLAITFPSTHFEQWESKEVVPLQVTADGRVFGHAAGDGCFRNGSKAGICQKYTPDPDPEMKNFHTATVVLDTGDVLRVGNLTCASLHASTSLTHEEQRHYHENTSTVWARVRAWNDSRGRLCISGSVIPGLDDRLLAQVAGQPLSVELWPVPGVPGNTLVGAHSVVTPAWPT